MISTHPADHADAVPVSDIPGLPEEYVDARAEFEREYEHGRGPVVVDVRRVWVRVEGGEWIDYDDAVGYTPNPYWLDELVMSQRIGAYE